MQEIYDTSSQDGPLFRYLAMSQMLVLECLSGIFSERLEELYRAITFTGVPTDTTLSQLVAQAVDRFRQPPLLAGIAEDEIMVVLCPKGSGRYYNSLGLPLRRRWVAKPVGENDLGSKTILEVFLRKSEISAGGITNGRNSNYVLNIG